MSNMHRQYQLLRAGTVFLFWLSSSVSPVAQSQAAGSSTMPRLVMYSGVVIFNPGANRLEAARKNEARPELWRVESPARFAKRASTTHWLWGRNI